MSFFANVFWSIRDRFVKYEKPVETKPKVEPEPDPNIVDIATGSNDFNILVKALSTAGLVETIRDANDITVFAPTDAAFAQLAADLGYTGSATDEDAVFDFLVGALSDLGGGDASGPLTDILTYHVSPGAKTAKEVDEADEIATLNGATFATEGTQLIDNEPDIDDPSIVTPDIAASNGTIQVIDRVLLPQDIPGNTPDPVDDPLPTLTGIVAASGGEFDGNSEDFDLLLNAVQAADLAGALDDPNADLTVFAPNDAAFVGLAQALGFKGSDEGGAFSYIVESLTLLSGGHDPIPLLKNILLYHVAPGSRDADDVLSSTEIPTLLGSNLGVDGASLVDGDPDIADPNIIATNIPASNGIAHVLDGVLIPLDILQSDGSHDVDFIVAGDKRDHIYTGRDNDFVDGNGGNDVISTGKGDDVALGGDGNDRIFGRKGDDTLKGGEGDDHIYGGRGNDIISGGAGHDRMSGGKGHDTFDFDKGDGRDVIYGFKSGQDKVDLSDFDFDDFHDLSGALSGNNHKTVVSIGDDKLTINGLALDHADEHDFILIA